MSKYDNDSPELTPEEQEEFNREMEEAANDPNNPDHEFAKNMMQGRSMQNPMAGGMIIPIFPPGAGFSVFSPVKSRMDPKYPKHLKPVHEYPTCYMFNQQYIFRILDAIYTPPDDPHPDWLTVSMEIEQNARYKGKHLFKSLMDLQEYLEKSQIINFLLAFYMGNASAWDLHNFHYNVLITDTYAKILITVDGASKELPIWVDRAEEDEYQEYRTTTVSTSASEPAQIMVHRKKHLWLPLIKYHITMNFNASTGVDTKAVNFNPMMVFNQAVHPQLEDAIGQFYSKYTPIGRELESSETALHCAFRVFNSGGLIQITLYCSPARIAWKNDDDVVHLLEYEFNGLDEHLVGVDDLKVLNVSEEDSMLTDYGVPTFTTQYASTASSQLFPINYLEDGVITKGERFLMSSREQQILFMIEHRASYVANLDPWRRPLWEDDNDPFQTPGLDNDRLYVMTRYRASKKHRDIYLSLVGGERPIKVLSSVTNRYEQGYIIYGFIEFSIPSIKSVSLQELLQALIKDEQLMEKLHLPPVFKTMVDKSILHHADYPDITFLEVYRSPEIWRLMVYELWRNEFLNSPPTSS